MFSGVVSKIFAVKKKKRNPGVAHPRDRPFSLCASFHALPGTPRCITLLAGIPTLPLQPLEATGLRYACPRAAILRMVLEGLAAAEAQSRPGPSDGRVGGRAPRWASERCRRANGTCCRKAVGGGHSSGGGPWAHASAPWASAGRAVAGGGARRADELTSGSRARGAPRRKGRCFAGGCGCAGPGRRRVAATAHWRRVGSRGTRQSSVRAVSGRLLWIGMDRGGAESPRRGVVAVVLGARAGCQHGDVG